MGERRMIAVGKIDSEAFGFRLKETIYEEDGDVWVDLDPMPARTSEEGWGYLDGETLE